ncbi:Polymerase/histidinol phosphatase-like [Moorella glycerini]|uniref:PHP domain protein n=1 Tax=Neomoorella stamsii TaxID=1266720 RepID=A0A9X7J107_9FIRM|nr:MULTISPECIES: PHP domain-containing protein [Moorella]PRR71107.1 PHP domain protein [Moorella stamsii]CEP67937.1 Polymerase/histidinol phosphatase-like [Moorella glycerini]
MALYRADLHIHTALSPCAGEEMTPPRIVAAALAAGLQVIAVTDHNSAANVAAVREAALGSGLVVMAGMEVQTREDVHLVCLFDTPEDALAWQEEVYHYLPSGENREDYFGPQLILDAAGRERAREKRLLLASTGLGVEEVAGEVAGRGGLCLPAHVDRPSYSLLASLGFIPSGLQVAAVELGLLDPPAARKKFPALAGWPLVAASDAHYLKDIGRRATEYDLEVVNITALAHALQHQQFKVVIYGGRNNFR